jgi:hypothetical protein
MTQIQRAKPFFVFPRRPAARPAPAARRRAVAWVVKLSLGFVMTVAGAYAATEALVLRFFQPWLFE